MARIGTDRVLEKVHSVADLFGRNASLTGSEMSASKMHSNSTAGSKTGTAVGRIVSLRFGPKPTGDNELFIREHLLREISPFMSRRLDEMAAQQPNVFFGYKAISSIAISMFARWLFTEQLFTGKLWEGNLQINGDNLLDLFFLARDWDIEALENKALDTIRRYYEGSRSHESLPATSTLSRVRAQAEGETDPIFQVHLDILAKQLVGHHGVAPSWELRTYVEKDGVLMMQMMRAARNWAKYCRQAERKPKSQRGRDELCRFH